MIKEAILECVVLALFCTLAYQIGIRHGMAESEVKTIVVHAPPIQSAPSKVSDAQCAAWLFDSNIKEAKQRICAGGSK